MTRAQFDDLEAALRQVQELAARLDPTPPDDARARE